MDHLSPNAKRILNKYNQAFDTDEKYETLVDASTWLDDLRYWDVNWFNAIHYCDLPFSKDETPLPSVPKINAVWAINQASHTLLSSKAKDKDKGLALRILLHVVGDIHQPLHGVTQVSKEHPRGDFGGNLFPLGENGVAANLHAYWDKGGGLLNNVYSKQELNNLVAAIERKYPCKKLGKEKFSAKAWAKESHHIARIKAYTLDANDIPSEQYQETVKETSQQRIAYAGCRLAFVLNQIDAKLARKERMPPSLPSPRGERG